MARVPKYRHHKNSGRAVVTINGKDYYLGKYDTKESKQAYKRLIAEWQAPGRTSSFGVVQDKTTIAMLVTTSWTGRSRITR